MKEKIPERYPPITEVKEKEESTMPTIEELDNLLNTSKELLENAVISEKEIDEMIEKRQEALEQIQNIELILESRLRKVENFNPLKDLTPDDYEGLVQEGIIDVAYAERLKKLDELISQLESVEFPTLEAKAKLEELASVRRAIREKIESQIEQRQEEIAERREELRNKILEHYGKRIKELEKIVAEIESNPQVIERLQTMAEKEYKEFQEGIEKERQRIIHEATRCIQSLSARHARVINRIGEILDDEKFINKLMNILWDRDEKKLKIELNKIRNVLIKSIIEGEGKKQIKDPAEVVPWKIRSTSIRYIDAMNFLLSREVEEILEEAAENGNKQAEKLLDERTKIIFQNKILRKFFRPQWITDPKKN
jgi:CHASE3 domain sensor protein